MTTSDLNGAIRHHRHIPGTCLLGQTGGVDGLLDALAWCGCGWNRTRLTRPVAARALRRHYAHEVTR